MSRLFTYCLPFDDGAAPNPFWGMCTLAICKPRIRSVAQVDDWVVGTGSVDSPIGDIAGQIVYAMRVERVLTLRDYDRFAQSELPQKIPDMKSRDSRRRVGDAIYDFSSDPPSQRASVHGPENMPVDLGGRNVLLSQDFYYFGDRPRALPSELAPIVKQGQGHKSSVNQPYFDAFNAWIRDGGLLPGALVGSPQLDITEDPVLCAQWAIVRAADDGADVERKD